MSDRPVDGRVQRVVWLAVPEERVAPGVIRQVVHGARQTLVRYRYDPGTVFPIHGHPEEQITVVVAGRIAFDVGGERIVLAAGELLVLPGGVPHGATVVGDEPVETLNTLSPRRAGHPAATATEGSAGGLRRRDLA